jgi:hypothetical protein
VPAGGGQQDRLQALPLADLVRRLETFLELGFEGRLDREFERRSCQDTVVSHSSHQDNPIVPNIMGKWYKIQVVKKMRIT